MSQLKSRGLWARATRALNKAFGSRSSLVPPSPPSIPSVSLLLPVDGTPGACLGAPSPSNTLPELASSAAPFSAPSVPTGPLCVPLVNRRPATATAGGIVWSGLNTALHTLYNNATVSPPLQSVIGKLVSGFEMFEESTRNQNEYEMLALELKTMSETLDRHLQGSDAPPIMDFIMNTTQSIQELIDFIAIRQNRDQAGRLREAQRVREALTMCYGYVQALTRQLQIEAGLSMKNIVSERQNAQLEKINPAKLATYDSSLAVEINRRACTENTRTGLFSDIGAWLADPNAPNVCWMNGMAGTGKTTIAYTFAKALEQNDQLAATFFCTRTTAECRDVARIIPTIAYQLARRSIPFLSALSQVLREDPDILSRAISTQFVKFLKDPLLKIKDTISNERVVVIDALDECTAGNGVKLTLDTLLREAPNLPLKFFVTSRPEPSIRNRIKEQPEDSRTIYELHNVKQSEVQADIELYLHEELPSISQPYVTQLAEQSGRLFIYAATAVRYIQAGNMEDRLMRMLSIGSMSKKGYAEIDLLYTTILSAALNSEILEEDELERMRVVLWTAVCAREPMGIQALSDLTGINDSRKTLEALEPLHSVLYISEDYSIVSTLHASFPDFMFNQSRSLIFFCNSEQHDALLARRCFDLMREKLRFNMCGLESSYVPDEMIPDLEGRVKQAITPTLAYVCRYWADHLQNAPASDDLHTLLADFLLERLFFWMEMMNLKHWMGIAVRVILVAKQWIMVKQTGSELLNVAEDVRNFVTSFAANDISQCTPHLYISAMSFCRQSSAVHKHYRHKVPGLMEPKGAGIETRYEAIIASWKVRSGVTSIAYSPDSGQIAAGCCDGSIIVKDALDGTPIFAPLKGHTGRVTSVAFSPNGALIASGSADHTICIWNAETGVPLGPLLQGHNSIVNSVAFSSEGTRIVSSSDDKTVRIWNSQGNAPVSVAIEGHFDSVKAAVFSPDNEHIISVSWDKTVCIWTAQSGTLAGAPLKGHTGRVNSVAISPNGMHIISGSDDNTIRMWRVQGGTSIGAPLKGHAGEVYSVAFSSDGKRIVSGSQDDTIRIWSAEDGAPIGAPLKGHTGSINSVAFSPDGTQIASGSDDESIQIWDAQDVTSTSTSSGGHANAVNSVAFSIDGTRILSGSFDQTVRTWNSQDGAANGNPLEGHTGGVTSVAFSPDDTRIVSGSIDKTIRVWNSRDGTAIWAPLKGHTESVNSVAFSPNSVYIVSGSSDQTICIWNAQHGTPIGEPLMGHTDRVNSAEFSPDGALIVSCSNDKTIRIWKVDDHTLFCAPLEGHTGPVCSVVFSSDSTRIASGSYDNTIRIWSVQQGTMVCAPCEGHNGPVLSVAFSSDGKRVASGSQDKTIRVWNSQDGTLIGAPFEGHTDFVMSVAFSPDGAQIISGSADYTVRSWKPHDHAPFLDTWSVQPNGWVLGAHSQRLISAPPDILPYLPTPRNHWVIGPNGSIRIDYSKILARECWHTNAFRDD